MFPFPKRQRGKYPLSYRQFLSSKKAQGNDPYQALCDDGNTNCDIRIALAEDQGYICCYCQRQLPEKDFSYRENEETIIKKGPNLNIEHFKAKSIYNGQVSGKSHPDDERYCDDWTQQRQDLRVQYDNLLGACLNDEHCGASKADKELCFIPNPATLASFHSLQLSCDSKGILKSAIDGVNEELGGNLEEKSDSYKKGKLNLNCKKLRDQRAFAIKAIIQRLAKKQPNWWEPKPKLIQEVKELYQFYQQRQGGKHQPLYGFILLFLKKHFKTHVP